jgi:hypothetical protein
MIRKLMVAAAMVATLGISGAHAGSIDVCNVSTSGPGNSGGVTVSEGGVTVSWGGGANGSGGAHQCLHVEHP